MNPRRMLNFVRQLRGAPRKLRLPPSAARVQTLFSPPGIVCVIDPRRWKNDIVKSGDIVFKCYCRDDAPGILTVFPDGRLKIECVDCGLVEVRNKKEGFHNAKNPRLSSPAPSRHYEEVGSCEDPSPSEEVE